MRSPMILRLKPLTGLCIFPVVLLSLLSMTGCATPKISQDKGRIAYGHIEVDSGSEEGNEKDQ